MDLRYQPRGNARTRVFKSSLISPLLVVLIIVIFISWQYFYISNADASFMVLVEEVAFEVALLCVLGYGLVLLVNRRLLKQFLKACPVIANKDHVSILKPVVRTNMYCALMVFSFLGAAALATFATITTGNLVGGVILSALLTATTQLGALYRPYEEQVKEIPCTDPALESELTHILQTWMSKALPDF